MTDDLVFRLKQMEEFFHLDYHRIKKIGREAANRIENLEAQLAQSQLKRWAARWEEQADRIEKLEAALREIADGQRDADKSYAELFAEVRAEARKALEDIQ